MPLHPSRPAPLTAVGLALLASLTVAGAARSAPSAPAPAIAVEPDDQAALVVARDRIARADAAVEALKRALTPGHLTDPTPEADGAYGLETLRAEVADLQRQAAGYRATLGDRHPTLVGTEQVLTDMKGQLLDATRKALTSASREAADARAAVDRLDQRLAARTAALPDADAHATGTIASAPAAAAHPRVTDSPAALPGPREEPAEAAAPTSPRKARRVAPRSVSDALIILAAGVLALLLIAGGLLRLLRGLRRGAQRPARRVEPALRDARPSAPPETSPTPSLGVAESAPVARDVVPLLATLPLPRSQAVADVAARFTAEPHGALARAAAALHATLSEAIPRQPGERLTVLLTGAAGLDARDGDLAALTLALAAAAAGRRVVILETRAAGRLRGTLVPAGTVPILVEAGGTERTLYRVDAGSLTMAVLPTDPGEAEAAIAAGQQPQTGRFRGLGAFDMVVLAGEDAPALARSADVVVIATSAETTPEAVADVARTCGEAGRICGALAVTRVAAPSLLPLRSMGRRRVTPDPAPTALARLGLRGSIEPSRRRAGR